ncbi:hypothetical protein HDV05_004522 [Chytridiales sp. JEL 0842]|nr:hypothetical protein HDV05_004522 [Chytridiales sp. JEL 0842]
MSQIRADAYSKVRIRKVETNPDKVSSNCPSHQSDAPPSCTLTLQRMTISMDDLTPTNTLILTNLTPPDFEDNGKIIRELLGPFGRVLRLTLLKSFNRILAVFESCEDADMAKRSLHKERVGGREWRVYFGEHTDLNLLQPNPNPQPLLLQVPATEKNFLLSPPGSPPVGWVQGREEGPNPGGHAAVWHALREGLESDELHLGEPMDLMDHDDHHQQLGRGARVEHPVGKWEGGCGSVVEGTWGHREHMAVEALRIVEGVGGAKKQVLTFGPAPDLEAAKDQMELDSGGMSWSVTLPIVVVENVGGGGEEEVKKVNGHKNIVRYFDSSVQRLRNGDYEVLILMEYCPGGHLVDFLNTKLQTRLTEHEVLKIFSDVCEAVAHMHYLPQPILHRDLKIENVLIAADGTYKLCDFGSATTKMVPPATSLTASDIRKIEDDVNRYTTLQYRAPELCDLYQKRGITEKIDMWALGVLLYKLCFFTTPFEESGTLAIINVRYTKYTNETAPAAAPAPQQRGKRLSADLSTASFQNRNIIEGIPGNAATQIAHQTVTPMRRGRPPPKEKSAATLGSASSSGSLFNLNAITSQSNTQAFGAVQVSSLTDDPFLSISTGSLSNAHNTIETNVSGTGLNSFDSNAWGGAPLGGTSSVRLPSTDDAFAPSNFGSGGFANNSANSSIDNAFTASSSTTSNLDAFKPIASRLSANFDQPSTSSINSDAAFAPKPSSLSVASSEQYQPLDEAGSVSPFADTEQPSNVNEIWARLEENPDDFEKLIQKANTQLSVSINPHAESKAVQNPVTLLQGTASNTIPSLSSSSQQASVTSIQVAFSPSSASQIRKPPPPPPSRKPTSGSNSANTSTRVSVSSLNTAPPVTPPPSTTSNGVTSPSRQAPPPPPPSRFKTLSRSNSTSTGTPSTPATTNSGEGNSAIPSHDPFASPEMVNVAIPSISQRISSLGMTAAAKGGWKPPVPPKRIP